MNTILYEEHRNLIKRAIKQNLKLSFLEIIILDKLKHFNKEKIDAVDLKNNLKIENTPISIQINNLSRLGLFKKSRDEHDERRIYLYDIDLKLINEILEQYDLIVSSVLTTE